MKNNPVKIFNDVAESYSLKYMDVSKYAEGLNTFLDVISDEATILDIGCGPGNVAKFILDKSSKLKYTGIDLAPKMISQARKNAPMADFQVADCINIEDTQIYNAVIISFFIPYINDQQLKTLLSNIRHAKVIYLATLIHETKNIIEKQKSPESPVLRTYYHKLDDLKSYFEKNYKLFYTNQYNCEYPGETEVVMVWKLKDYE